MIPGYYNVSYPIRCIVDPITAGYKRNWNMLYIPDMNDLNWSVIIIWFGVQWLWWQQYVGDFMMVTILDVGDKNNYVGAFSLFWWFLTVINRSPTSLIGLKVVSNTFCLQHPLPTSIKPTYMVYYLTYIINRLTKSLPLEHCCLRETPATVEAILSNEFILLLK